MQNKLDKTYIVRNGKMKELNTVDGKIVSDSVGDIFKNKPVNYNHGDYKRLCYKAGNIDVLEHLDKFLFDYLLMCQFATLLSQRDAETLRLILIRNGCDVNADSYRWFMRNDGLACRNKDTGKVLPY